MKLTISRIALLFGLILFVNFYFFNGAISELILAVIFGGCTVFSILNRKTEKPYTYERGLLIGVRILFFGILYTFLFLLIASVIEIFKPLPLVSPDGKSITETIQDRHTFLLYEMGSNSASILITLIFSLIPMLLIPFYFFRKLKQNNDSIDADLMNNEQK